MAEKLTPQQEMAVKDRGGMLLVSAAAGSGKTKVLVDRLMSYVLDPVDPANLDEFLIITYTKAAASELRGKIAAKLSEHMAAQPENRHLQRQMQRLYLAKISTVHSFCADILKEYSYMLKLPADFRVADENECLQLRTGVMTAMLERAYTQAQDDPDFRAFVDNQGLGRDDRLVPEILFKVYDSARCHRDPDAWMQKCIRDAGVEGLTDAGKTIWGRYLMEDLFSCLDLQIRAMKRCADLADAAEGMAKPAALLRNTVLQLEQLRGSKTWDEILQRRNIDYGRLVFSSKCPDQELAEHIKAVRKACKDGLDKKLKVFTDESAVVLADIRQTSGAVRGVAALVSRFDEEYSRVKRSRRVLDFSDLEHRMLDLLWGKTRSHPTVLATEIGSRFREIMVDEYQDSNAVQDAIFMALTAQRNNCFMVGDVKQSIYQFRLADPSIFLEKYGRYTDAEQALPGEGRKVLLSANFRSGGAVLKSVNDIFELCMSPAVGGLHYGPEEALREGIPHQSLGEPEVELWAVDVRQDTYVEEAAFVAGRIRELLDGNHYVRQGDALRPIRPEDVAILLRSPGSVGSHYIDALQKLGLRCTSGGGEDLLQTPEISALRALLQTISNPRQDIPLIASLASPVFGFTADDLAQIRSKRRDGCVYDALCASDMPKARDFLNTLHILRREARMQTLAKLIEQIFIMTRMDSVYGAMSGGDLRRENLQTFYALAVSFESVSRHDLEQFLEHLDALEDKGLIAAGQQSAAGAVTLMSIHKSKGLEFPVVFVCGLGRRFNTESARGQVLCDQMLGLGLSVVDGRNRLRYPTAAKRAIASKILADGLSEELRVLYVALTRARDRLIMTYASDSLEKDLTQIVARMDLTSPELMTMDVSCAGAWVLQTALRRTEAGALFEIGGYPDHRVPGEPEWKIGIATVLEQTACAGEEEIREMELTAEELETIRRGLAFRYGHTAATQTPSKQTATQRKGRQKDAEAAENTPEVRHSVRAWRKPSFVEAASTGADRGTAFHAVMQYLDFAQCSDADAVKAQIRDLVLQGLITPERAALVDHRRIARFFETPIGRKLRHGGQVLREFKFTVLDPAEKVDPALSGEKILLQGVVDCALIEEDGITVLDFKTDRVTEETLAEKMEYYRPQVMAYADAIGRIFGKTVKQKLLYFFGMDRLVEIK